MLSQAKFTLLFAILLNLLMLSSRVVANDATDPNCAFTLMNPDTSDFNVDDRDYIEMQYINPLDPRTDPATSFRASIEHPDYASYCHIAAKGRGNEWHSESHQRGGGED